MFAICLVVKERHYQLPSVPARGHSLVLLIFFTLEFISQNVSLVNINSKDWWFNLESKQDRIEMALFVTRYVCTLFMFVLGLKAPGITSVAAEDEDFLVQNEANDVSGDDLWGVDAHDHNDISSRKTDRLSGTDGRKCEP